MKAIVQTKYGSPGDVLRLQDISKPVVKDDEVLVRVHAASVHPDVWHVVRGRPYILRLMGAGLLKPKNRVPGTDVAGRVESVGSSVTQFRQGDEVFGETTKGYQWNNGGAYAEYVSAPQNALVLKPVGVTFEQAAAVPSSGLIALSGLRHQGKIQAGQKVLINGAGGGVGVLAVQIAKAYEAEVTGVDHTGKLDMIRSVGADHVIDSTQDNFTQRGGRYDLILDIPGNHSISELRRVLTPKGRYILIGHDRYDASGARWFGRGLPRFLKMALMSLFVSELRVKFSMPAKKDSMTTLKEFIESGKIKPIVDRTFPLSEVTEAIRYLEKGQARGKVVITL